MIFWRRPYASENAYYQIKKIHENCNNLWSPKCKARNGVVQYAIVANEGSSFQMHIAHM
jgi:hypothetical protein